MFFLLCILLLSFFFQAEDGIRDRNVTGVQTCALPIFRRIICHAASRGYKTLCTGKELSINQPSKGINVLTRPEQEIGRASCRERVSIKKVIVEILYKYYTFIRLKR